MKALAKLLLVVLGLVGSGQAQESSPTPNGVDEPALPDSKLEIPHPPSSGLLPVAGAIPNPTPVTSPTLGIYSPIKTKIPVVPTSTVKPPLRPKTQNKAQKRFEEVRSIAMQSPHVAYLLKRANKASSGSARRSLMRAYYAALNARMRKLEPGLKSSIKTYEMEKTGTSSKATDTKAGNSKKANTKQRSHSKKDTSPGTHSARHKHSYSHRVPYPSDYSPYARYGPYGE
jgi:hypothetical protein